MSASCRRPKPLDPSPSGVPPRRQRTEFESFMIDLGLATATAVGFALLIAYVFTEYVG